MNKSLKMSLAYYGGKPIRKKAMPSRKAITKKEIDYINYALNYYQNLDEDPPYDGYFQKLFENDFSKKMKGGFSAAVCSGSVACFVGLRAMGLPKKSEVLISPVTDSGSLFAIIECGLKPVVIDSMKETYNTSWEQIRKGINKNTSALFLVHCSGNPLEMKRISKESKKLGIKIIEDCSQAPFARVCKESCKKSIEKKTCNGNLVGSYGDLSVFSTMYRKNIQTGGSGGIVFTKDYKLHKRIIEESDRGKPKWSKKYDSRNPGQANISALNYNTDELSCAIGIQSLKKIDLTIKKRMLFIKGLSKLMNKEKQLIFKSAKFYNGTSPFLLPIIVKEPFSKKKELIAKMLISEGISLSPKYNCVVSEWKITKKMKIKVIEEKNAKNMQKISFNLFLNENYGRKEINDIFRAFKKISSYFNTL